ncbi:MAG: LEA type 2 family protein [Opitutaceae bacterium]|nr:LEA type 2 family protein [Opitutaceae bacterium]
MTSLRFLSVFTLLCGLLASGCQTRYSIGEISVAVVDLKPAGGSMLESRAVMTVRYFNENVVPIAFTSTTHKLYLNGTYVGKAVSNQAVGLPPASTTTQDVVVFFENTRLLTQLLDAGRSQSATYKLVSTLTYQKGDDTERVPAEATGTIDLGALAR